MRAWRDVRGEIDIEYASDWRWGKLNPGGVRPDLRRPRLKFSGGGDRERCSSLAGDRVEVGERRLRARGRGCEQNRNGKQMNREWTPMDANEEKNQKSVHCHAQAARVCADLNSRRFVSIRGCSD